MRTNDVALDLITRMEEFRAEPYQDAAGVWTVGYGHTRSAVLPTKVSQDEAVELLFSDVRYFEEVVLNAVEVPLNEYQFGALVSLVFNIGEKNFRTSTLLKKLNKGDYLGAAKEFYRWRKAGGRVLNGLVRRRAYEEQLFRTPPPVRLSVEMFYPEEAENAGDTGVSA